MVIGVFISLLCALANVAVSVLGSLYASRIDSYIKRKTEKRTHPNPE
ncbi:MAG: hypothetical protein FWB75_05860 [Oscillospiraceae bacterium]|nr:hypothetical protein [Oscillospiraceae bacterium]